MKRTFLTILLATIFVGGVFAQTEEEKEDKETITLDSESKAKIEFTKTSHDFGTVTEGTQATVEFTFKNTGDAPLVLTSVTASCGCTTPKWTREPIPPGGTGSVTAIYNSRGRPGKFTKTITVKHNGEGGTQYLTIRGNVEKKAEEPQTPVKTQ